MHFLGALNVFSCSRLNPTQCLSLHNFLKGKGFAIILESSIEEWKEHGFEHSFDTRSGREFQLTDIKEFTYWESVSLLAILELVSAALPDPVRTRCETTGKMLKQPADGNTPETDGTFTLGDKGHKIRPQRMLHVFCETYINN